MSPNLHPVPRLIGFSPGHDCSIQQLHNVLQGALSAGLKALVIREPNRPKAELAFLVHHLQPVLGAGLILHASHPSAVELAEDRELSLHLPSHLSARGLRERIRGWIGQSCHTDQELQQAEAFSCDYVTLSPIFPPISKPDDSRRTLGISALAIRTQMFRIPIFALGGITADQISRCMHAGCHGIASMGSLFRPNGSAKDAYRATRLLIEAHHSNH